MVKSITIVLQRAIFGGMTRPMSVEIYWCPSSLLYFFMLSATALVASLTKGVFRNLMSLSSTGTWHLLQTLLVSRGSVPCSAANIKLRWNFAKPLLLPRNAFGAFLSSIWHFSLSNIHDPWYTMLQLDSPFADVLSWNEKRRFWQKAFSAHLHFWLSYRRALFLPGKAESFHPSIQLINKSMPSSQSSLPFSLSWYGQEARHKT